MGANNVAGREPTRLATWALEKVPTKGFAK